PPQTMFRSKAEPHRIPCRIAGFSLPCAPQSTVNGGRPMSMNIQELSMRAKRIFSSATPDLAELRVLAKEPDAGKALSKAKALRTPLDHTSLEAFEIALEAGADPNDPGNGQDKKPILWEVVETQEFTIEQRIRALEMMVAKGGSLEITYLDDTILDQSI